MNFKTLTNRRFIPIIFLVSIMVMLPIIFLGIPSGNDLPQHYQFAQTYHNSIISGDGFPSWSDKENYGFGSIGIRFYPPFSYYVLAAFRMLCGNWFDASWMTFIFWMTLGCCGVYFWSRRWLSPKISMTAALFYAVIPYHLSQLYSFSFFYADFAGSAVLPFCFAFLTRIFERGKRSDILGFAVAFGLLVLTHLPTTIIGSLSLAVYTLFFLKRENILRNLFKASAGILLGLAASAFFWLPLISEMKWLNHASDRYSTGHYGFANRFFPLYFHAASTDNRDNFILSDVMISLCLLFLISAVVFLFHRRKDTPETSGEMMILRKVLPLGVFAVLMLTPLSTPIWKLLTPLQKTQFPLRWMAVVSICGTMVAATSLHFLLQRELLKRRTWFYIITTFACVIFLFNCVYVWDPGAFVPISRDKFESEMQKLPEERNQVFWWSIWSKDFALKSKEKVTAENREAAISDWKPEHRSFTVREGNPTSARIATFYYPHWQAEVNGSPVKVEMDENGAMLVPIPAEKSTVKLYFQEPLKVRVASLVSLMLWLMLGGCGLFFLAKKSFAVRRPLEKLPEPHTAN